MSQYQNPQQNLRDAEARKKYSKFVPKDAHLHGTGRLVVSTERFGDLGAHKVLRAINLNMQHDSESAPVLMYECKIKDEFLS